MSSALATQSEDTALARARLLEIHARCIADRFAYFPRHARDLLESGHTGGIVVFGTRGLGFPQQLDAIEHVVALNPGLRIAAVVDDESAEGAPAHPVRAHPTLTVQEFFASASRFTGCLVVDRTCTWSPGVRYKVRFKQNGLAYLRVEQFLNAPALSVGAGFYRGHSDLMMERFEDFLALESLWADEYSTQTYYYALASFISMNHEYFAFHCGNYSERYFPPDLGLSFGQDAVYADCGAFDGTEALYFAELTQRRFKAVHVFEPGRDNYIAVCDNVNRYVAAHGALPIYCHEMGVYDRNAYLRFDGYQAGVTISGESGDGAAGLHVCRLDDALDELSYLRLEIEGAELAALHGARGLIRRFRPGMTISAYHMPTDFLDIAGFLREMDLGYEVRLRHQSLEAGVLCVYCTR